MSTCATASSELGEPLAGTAATARTWLLLEQAGPWGSEALLESHLDPALGRALKAATEGTGVRVALIRRPGRHADFHQPARRRLYVAHTAPGRAWVRHGTTADPRELLGLDLAALGAGAEPGHLDAYDADPLALVCTNGKRDRCCALLGRPLAAALHASGGTNTWEITHIGGHRFSPTLLLLPHGYAYGRVSAHDVKEITEAAYDGRVVLDGCRGRSTWERPAQSAELAVRAHARVYGPDELTVVRTEGADPHWTVTVAHRDGRAWAVDVSAEPGPEPSPASCGAAALPQLRLVAGEPRVLDAALCGAPGPV
ncbi:sucrase ferredoxin [Streptomyces sp. NPDC051940]|uniref:sucrase ferredoxin n=1 Tax=Streptomyces sp. NPDC051940 TaxID=3155675 RepID=UPI0034362FA7